MKTGRMTADFGTAFAMTLGMALVLTVFAIALGLIAAVVTLVPVRLGWTY